MKKNALTLLLAIICSFAFAQKVIENPDFGLSSLPGTITKIELLDTTTVLYFHIKYAVGQRISVPKQTFIKDVSANDMLFITKAEGTEIGKWHVVPDSGELFYKLYFPKLGTNVKIIDFGEANAGGSWAIYDIEINKEEDALVLPKALRGSWLLADGSNQFHYGFYSKNAVLDRAVWNYKSVESNGKKHKITLENHGKEKTVYAKLGKDGLVDFGTNSKELKSYSLERVYNPDYKLTDNTPYNESMFKIDSTTYSGLIKGYTNRVEEKTGTIYVNNPFSGNQDSYLVKVAEDGSFSVKFPVNHPQSVLVRLPYSNTTVFVEPGKEIFHVIEGKESYFMGDLAQLNSDLNVMKSIQILYKKNPYDYLGETSPEDYKKMCFDIRNKELEALKTLQSKHTISKKALQVKKLDIDYSTFQNVLGYDMYRGGISRMNQAAKTEEEKKPYKEFTVDDSFYDFIKEEHMNDKLSVLSNDYHYFINRLMFADVFRSKNNVPYTTAELVDLLLKDNKEITVEELAMAEISKEIQTPEVLAKEAAFREVYGNSEQAFYRKYANDYTKYVKDNKVKPNHTNFMLNIVDYLKEKGELLTEDEVALVEAIKNMKTEEEQHKEKMFNETYGNIKGQLYNKYKDEIQELSSNKFYLDIDNNMKTFFNVSQSFMFDVITSERASRRLEDYRVYSDSELKSIQQNINNPIISNYLAIANEKTKAKIELNKTKGGYTVNTVNKTEGDELFDAMLKKFEGKVVYVDFWATWCGPCKSGIKRIAPLKEEMKDDDVVFLYVTNQTSPEGTWKNAITDIKGEHYRVSADEWNYLADKFNISGIPHYVLVNKDGEVVKPKMGHSSNDILKEILKAEIER